MDRSTRFWDRTAERYAKSPIRDEASYRERLERTREYLRPDMEVLELGCGTGTVALEHAPHVKHVHGVDLSSKMIEIARRKAAEAGASNVTFARSSVEELADDRRFHAVLALNVLHLVVDRDAVLKKALGMLEPGGVFVSNTACLGDRMRFLALVAPLGRMLGLLPRVAVFTRAELETSLVAAGFEILDRWSPDKGPSFFVVARKPASAQ